MGWLIAYFLGLVTVERLHGQKAAQDADAFVAVIGWIIFIILGMFAVYFFFGPH